MLVWMIVARLSGPNLQSAIQVVNLTDSLDVTSLSVGTGQLPQDRLSGTLAQEYDFVLSSLYSCIVAPAGFLATHCVNLLHFRMQASAKSLVSTP